MMLSMPKMTASPRVKSAEKEPCTSTMTSGPISAATGTPKMLATGDPRRRGGRRLLLDQRAARVLERLERDLGRDRRADAVVVPGLLRLARLLHLEEVHLVDHPAVLADVHVLAEHVGDLVLLQISHHRV